MNGRVLDLRPRLAARATPPPRRPRHRLLGDALFLLGVAITVLHQHGRPHP